MRGLPDCRICGGSGIERSAVDSYNNSHDRACRCVLEAAHAPPPKPPPPPTDDELRAQYRDIRNKQIDAAIKRDQSRVLFLQEHAEHVRGQLKERGLL